MHTDEIEFRKSGEDSKQNHLSHTKQTSFI